ncbi:hypothetical protein MAR_013642 [Mya arenaria]|uniref:Uncharacterized protein n=2 Tax=Mya arenaria TaxID=6604 RepID=A0ABY7G466_MYAAR|nr:mucin-4-like isoform X2 [Mya arenaria]XP_052784263.1 mucin-4-like isoform X2 [Mya arenaria]WAR27938.1 hypothetical protein MAR_013642 [Mya arenaria]
MDFYFTNWSTKVGLGIAYEEAPWQNIGSRWIFPETPCVSGIFNFANGKEFTCEDGSGSTCIILEMDATFNLTMSGNKTQTSMFSLESATVDKGACNCQVIVRTTASISLKMFPSGDMLKVSFPKSPFQPFQTQKVSMTPLFSFYPHKHFNTSGGPTIIELTTGDIPIGVRDRSYTCMSSRNVSYERKQPYHMTMTITNLHVQAYDIQEGTLSPATTCSADISTVRPVTNGTTTKPTSLSTHKSTHSTTHSTTHSSTHLSSQSTTHPTNYSTTHPSTHSASTTHNNTTPTMTSHSTSWTPNMTSHTPTATTSHKTTMSSHSTSTMTSHSTSTMTSHSTQTKTTWNPTPMTTPFPTTHKYDLCNEVYCCVILQGNFSFTIPYEMENNKTNTLTIGVPDKAMVTGTCNLDDTNTTQEIDVDFFDGWKLSVVIKESTANGKELQARVDERAAQVYSWERVSLEYVLDDHFVTPKGKGENMTVKNELTFDMFKTDTLGSFACESEETLKLGEVDFLISKLQYRGFGHTNSTNFPKDDVKRCPQDLPKTTAKPGTTTKKPGHNKAGTIVGAVIGTLLALVLVIGGVMYYRKKKQQRESHYSDL